MAFPQARNSENKSIYLCIFCKYPKYNPVFLNLKKRSTIVGREDKVHKIILYLYYLSLYKRVQQILRKEIIVMVLQTFPFLANAYTNTK